MADLLSTLAEMKAFFIATELAIPAVQMIIYVVLINLMMLFGRYRFCYMISLVFSFYWLFILNQHIFVTADGSLQGGMLPYVGVGVCFLLLLGGSFISQGD